MKFASVVYTLLPRHDLMLDFTSDTIAAMALGTTHLFIMLYLSVKFHLICFSNF